MVFDPERGYVRGCGPEQTSVSLAVELKRSLWSEALPEVRHALTLRDLENIYTHRKTQTPLVEFPNRTHPVFPGFAPIGPEIGPDDVPVNLGYRCGYERIIYAGSPEIQESPERPGHIDFNCRMCKGTMYSEEVEPNRCRGFLAPEPKHKTVALDVEED